MTNGLNNLRGFKRFRLDAGRRILWHKDKPVKLALKEIELLCALTEKSGVVMTKNELLDKVWQDAFVEESNLTRHIYILRKTLAKLGEKNLIETIPGRGYRFTADVSEIDEAVDAQKPTAVAAFAETTELTAEPLSQNVKAVFPSHRLIVVTVVIAVLFGSSSIFLYRTRQARTHLAEIRSIAVLPFRTIDSDPQNEHQGMALTDLLITRLSNIDEINVRPTSAVFDLVGEDSITAGERLRVDAVLEGSIYRTSEKSRVTVRLIKVSDGSAVWSGQFENTGHDELRMQNEIVLQMIDALAMDLTGAERTALTKRFTESSEAYELYIKGRFEWNKRSSPAMDEAERLFRNAIDKDPNFALAYVGLADRLATNRDGEAGTLVRKALELDPNLAEAHATLGFIEMFYGWNWKGAEAALRKSIELNSNYATAHHWLATLLTIQGRHEEAKAAMRRALEINPVSHNFLADLGQIYYHTREYDKAKEYCLQAIAIYPDFVFPHHYLRYIYLQTGEYEKSIEAYWERVRVESNPERSDAGRRVNYLADREGHLQAYRERGIKAYLLESVQVSEFNGTSYFYSAMQNSFLGNREIALAHLDKAVDAKVFIVPFAKSDPIFDNIRDDPRFNAILRKINLDP